MRQALLEPRAGVAGLPRVRRAAVEPALVAGVLAAAWLVLAPPSTDLAAHLFRAELVREHGLVLWDNLWYGGHHTVAYSLLFPPLGALAGVRLVGAIAAVVAASAFGLLAERRWGPAARPGTLWFGAGTATMLLSGRLPFALGVALALLAALAAQRGRTAAAAGGAALAGLASPVAGLFLALGAGGWALVSGARPLGVARRTAAPGASGAGPLGAATLRGGAAGPLGAATLRRAAPALALGAAALGPPLALSVAFPEGGTHPFALSSLASAVAGGLVVTAALPRRERVLRAVAGLWVLACLVAFLVPSPLGGNVARLGALAAGPVLTCALAGRRPRLLAALALPLALWQWDAAQRDVRTAWGDPSLGAAYHAPLLGFLERRFSAEGPFRVEVPFTRNHWEALYLAREVPLARGWERQLDRARNPLFYARRALSPAAYAAWLRASGVRYVALPDVPLDPSAEREAALLRAGTVPGLRPAWRSGHWRVWAVRGGGLASGAAHVTALEPDAFALRASGAAEVRIRFSPYWALVEGRGCVAPAPDGFTLVRPAAPGPLRVALRPSLGRIGARSARCR